MTLEQKRTYEQEAVELLLSQFRDKANIEGLVQAFTVPLDEVEGVLFDLLNLRTLGAATGALLDGIGDIVGLSRGGLDDDDYRVRLRARIRANRSNGTGDDVLETIGLVISNALTLQELPPASFVMVIADALTEDPVILAAELARARAAGVRAQLSYTLAADAATFTTASGDTSETSTSQGLANDAQTTGGVLADVKEA